MIPFWFTSRIPPGAPSTSALKRSPVWPFSDLLSLALLCSDIKRFLLCIVLVLHWLVRIQTGKRRDSRPKTARQLQGSISQVGKLSSEVNTFVRKFNGRLAG